MNVKDLPTNLHNSTISFIHSIKSGRINNESLSRLWEWFEDEGHSLIVNAYDDWVVVDIKRLSEYKFSDSVLREDFELSPDQKITDVNDNQRLEFARIYLTDDEFNPDDDIYPSPVALDLTANNESVVIDFLLYPAGQAGMSPEPFGAFNNIDEFKASLIENGFSQISPICDDTGITDQYLLNLWQHESNS